MNRLIISFVQIPCEYVHFRQITTHALTTTPTIYTSIASLAGREALKIVASIPHKSIVQYKLSGFSHGRHTSSTSSNTFSGQSKRQIDKNCLTKMLHPEAIELPQSPDEYRTAYREVDRDGDIRMSMGENEVYQRLVRRHTFLATIANT